MKTLYARNTQCKKIYNNQIAEEFTNQYHRDNCPKKIRGFISYGLYHDDELLAVIIFGNPRTREKQRKYSTELVRLTFKSGTRIVGGASKLIHHYIDAEQPYDIFTYQDTTGETTDVYELSGFTLVKQDKQKEYLVKDGYTIKTANRKQKYGIAYVVQYGPDRILGTSLGQNTGKTNKQLFLENGYHSEYTTGDRLYEWFNPIWTHYTYKIVGDDGYYYIGAHSEPTPNMTVEECITDGYSGSGKRLVKWQKHHKWHKEIIATYPTRAKLFSAENKLLSDKWKTDDKCLNLCEGGRGSAKRQTSHSHVLVGINDIRTTNPELMDNWIDETPPTHVSHKSSKKLKWKCDKGHVWETTFAHRTDSDAKSCPYCYGRYPIAGETDFATTHSDLAKEWSSKNTQSPSEFTSHSNKKVMWNCVNGHEWETSMNHRVNGQNCPYCRGKKPIQGETDLATTRPEWLSEWDYAKNTISPSEIKRGSRQKVWWKCPKCGYSYQLSPNKKERGDGCPVESGKVVLEGYNDVASQFPQLVDEWSNKNTISLSEIPVGSAKKCGWKCKHGHEWDATIANRTKDKPSNCPYCSGKRILTGYNDLATLKPELMLDWDYTKNTLDPTKISKSKKEKSHWKCHKCGHEWEASISNRATRGTRCPNHKNHRPIIINDKPNTTTLIQQH